MRLTKMTTRISALLAACALIFTFVNPPASRADSKPHIMTATTDLAALPLGNPHYWLGPENGLRIAKGIQNKLSEMRSGDSTYFAQRYDSFEQRLKQADEKWLAEMKPYAGRKIVTYHRSWPNFAEHFHLDVVGYVEPRPGIPPSPQHTVELIGQMKRDGVKIIVVEPYFDLKTPNAIARDTGAQVVVLMPSVGGEKEITDYFKLFDYDIAKLKQAFDATK